MRRVLGPVLFAIGFFALCMAALTQFYVAPSLLVAPPDQSAKSVSEGTDATYLDFSTISIKTGQTLRATRTVRGDVAASNSDRVVWDQFLSVQNTADNSVVKATTDRVAFDPRTAEAVSCCGEHVDGKPTKHSGLSYKFPFGTEKKTYQFFDTTLKKALPAEFDGEDTVEGVEVYRFVQRIKPTTIASLAAPGRLVGKPNELLVPVEQTYANVRTMWVEPRTGVIVNGQEEQLQTLHTADGTDTAVLEATLRFTDETRRDSAATAADARSKAVLLGVTAPVTLLVVGLVLFVVGLALLRRRAVPAAQEDRQPVAAAADQE
jgi:hypothetical protein